MHHETNAAHHGVTPLAGVWIEIIVSLYGIGVFLVTPLAGVWIKI